MSSKKRVKGGRSPFGRLSLEAITIQPPDFLIYLSWIVLMAGGFLLARRLTRHGKRQ